MSTLLLIDLQNDFMPGGPLGVAEGDLVVPVANRAMDLVSHIVATQDWHPPDHGSFASQHPNVELGEVFELEGLSQIAWPEHCIQGTAGAAFDDRLHSDRIAHVVKKGMAREIDSYSGFFDNGQKRATGLDEYLKSIDSQELIVMGLATEYCVRFTVLDALRLGYRTTVVLEGCRGVNLTPADVDRAIEEMRQAGAFIVDSLTQIHEG